MTLTSAHQRKVLASVTLGCWPLAFFAGVVHACGLDGELGALPQVVSASTDTPGQGANDAGCGQARADNLPVLAKLPLVQNQPDKQAVPLPPSLGAPLPARVTPPLSPLHRRPWPSGASLNTHYVRLAL